MCLVELRDRVLMLPSLEKRMTFLQKEIKEAKSEVSNLLRQYEREKRDVEQMKNGSLSAFMFKLIGKYEDKLEKEQQEELNAKLAYDRASVHLESLISEREELHSRIDALKAEEKQYRAELDDRRRKISGKLSELNGVRYAELENERNAIVSQITEIEETLKIVIRAKGTAYKIEESLDSAEGWATWDMFTRGGIITHIAKYSHIDEAEENFDILSHELRELKAELVGIEGLRIEGFTEISSGQRAVDFWLDNIFTSWAVRDKIQDNAQKIGELIKDIERVEIALKSKLSEKEKEFAKNKQAEEELLISV